MTNKIKNIKIKNIVTSAQRPVSRRNLLKGLGISALGAGVNLASAQEDAASQGILGLEHTSVGDVQITVIKDSALQLPPDAFGGGAPEGAVSELLGQYNLPTGSISASTNVLLLQSGNDLTLVDTGNGGELLPTLQTLGVAPADITNVVLTHWHGDHVSGVSQDGTLNFPNAAYHFPALDWEFLQAQASSDENIQGSLGKVQPAEDAGQLQLYEGDAELVPGLTAVAAPGHTPGHHALLLSSGDKQLMIMGDTANHPLVALAHPEWSFGFDADAAQATETRRQIYGRAADEGLQLTAYHFAFPGFGYVSRDGEGFRFTASL